MEAHGGARRPQEPHRGGRHAAGGTRSQASPGDVLSDTSGNPRLAILRSFAEKRPQDPFPRYALAIEHKNSGDLLLAWQTLASLIADHPDYVAAYAPAAAVLCALDRKSEAREIYGKGIAAADRRKDSHARSHLETMLATLDADG